MRQPKANPNVPDEEADIQVIQLVAPGAGTDGEVVLSVPADATGDLLPTSYQYDIQMKTPVGNGSEIRTVVYGKIRFLAQITRSS